MKGTWQTTDSGGSRAATALIAGGAVLAAAIAGPVAVAAAELTRIVITIVVVVVVLALAAGIALEALRLRQRRANVSADMSPARPVSRRPADPLPAPQPRAISGPHEVHLHFHGVNAKDVAAILAERDRPGGLT